MKNTYQLFSIIAILFLLIGCSEDLLDENPPNLISSENLYTSFNGLESGINGLYSLVRLEREGLDGGTPLISDMTMNGTDALTTNHYMRGFANIARLWGDVNNPNDEFYAGVFKWLYFIINSSNTIIQAVEENTNIDWDGDEESNRNRILAEARVLRAWAYRHLTYGWGDVPLNMHPSSGSFIKTDWERKPVLEVREQIISDLLFAEKYVPTEAFLPGRITKGAIQHYLAEMYLALENPDSVLYWANQVIDNEAYKLITERYGVKSDQPGVPFMDMFYDGNSNREEGNTEALWVFQFALKTTGGGVHPIMRRNHHSRYVSIKIDGVAPLVNTIERGGRGYGRMSLTKWAIDNYEPQDERGSHYAIRKFFILKDEKSNAPSPADRLPDGYNYGDTIWLDWSENISTGNAGRKNWPFSRKWDWADPDNVGGSPQYNDQIYLRLGATYLLKAEAQYLLGDLEGAAESINILRRRANASEINSSDVDIDFILDERARELLVEGPRRYTLLRTNKWIERTSKYNHYGGELITDKDKLFPIPQSVIDINLTKEMPQNPGY